MTRHTKILISILLAIISLGGFTAGSTHALTYQDTLDTSFTFNSSIAITLSSSDLVISELTPNTYADSNIITITAASNNPTGYEVTATAGNGTTFTSTSLIDSENNSNPDSFTSLGTTDSYDISSNDFGYGKWGYTYSTDSGITWINANGTGYSGLPYYGNTGASIMSSNTAGSSNTDFKIGAKATATQLAGTYNNVVNFAVTANPEPDNSMQGFAAGTAGTTCSSMSIGDTIALIDSRDNTSYNVGKLADSKCWMLDNLALDLYDTSVLNSLSSANTNIDPNNESAILTSLKSGNRSAGDQYATAGLATWTSSYSNSVPMANLTNKEIPASYSTSSDPMKDTVIANNWKMGGYYNYCAASAGSYCFGDGTSIGTSSGDATSSICPKGWRMPTSKTSGEFATLYNAYSSASPDQYTAFRTAFRLPLSGLFASGSVYNQGALSYWWSATRYNDTAMYNLRAGTTTGINPSDYNARTNGFTLRCILGS